MAVSRVPRRTENKLPTRRINRRVKICPFARRRVLQYIDRSLLFKADVLQIGPLNKQPQGGSALDRRWRRNCLTLRLRRNNFADRTTRRLQNQSAAQHRKEKTHR